MKFETSLYNELNLLRSFTGMSFSFSLEELDAFNTMVTLNGELFVVETSEAIEVIRGLPDTVTFMEFYDCLRVVSPRIVSEQ